MKRKYLHIIWILSILFLYSTVVSVNGQDDDCPVDIQVALAQSQEVCVSIGRDQVCYGNQMVTVVPQPRVARLDFEQPGDLTDVVQVKSLSLSAMNYDLGVWGIAHMRLLANLPSSQLADVFLLLFGDVEIEDTAERRETLSVTVTVDENINVRRLPFLWAGAMGALAPGDTVTAIGRLEDNSWLRVELEEGDVVGWLATNLVTVDGDLDTLITETERAPYYGPMQAFFYSNGDSVSWSSITAEVLLIQTPEGLSRVSFLIEAVSIDFAQVGSTA